jgi:hypothetical protein
LNVLPGEEKQGCGGRQGVAGQSRSGRGRFLGGDRNGREGSRVRQGKELSGSRSVADVTGKRRSGDRVAQFVSIGRSRRRECIRHGSISAYGPPPVQGYHSMPSPSYSSFNPVSYTRAFFGSPISSHPGSFDNGNRYFPGSSPNQHLECVLHIPSSPLSLADPFLLSCRCSSLVLPTTGKQERYPPPSSRTEVPSWTRSPPWNAKMSS